LYRNKIAIIGTGSNGSNSTSIYWTIGATDSGISLAGGDIIRIKALYADTYVKMPHLTGTARVAETNDEGNEARVVEQNVSEAAAPYTQDFTLFVAHGSVCQAPDNITSSNMSKCLD
jgi:hypothetical protein